MNICSSHRTLNTQAEMYTFPDAVGKPQDFHAMTVKLLVHKTSAYNFRLEYEEGGSVLLRNLLCISTRLYCVISRKTSVSILTAASVFKRRYPLTISAHICSSGPALARMVKVKIDLFALLTHCGRVTQNCVFNTVKLGTSASSS